MKGLKTTWIAVTLLFFMQAEPAYAADWKVSEGWDFYMRGFASLDLDYDDSDLGGSEPLLPPRDDTAAAEQETFRASANQTQFGFGLKGKLNSNLNSNAYIEVDFLDESVSGNDRPNTGGLRMRHAYWQISTEDGSKSLLAGQFFTLFGAATFPEMAVDNLNLTLGSIFGREPQIQFKSSNNITEGSSLVWGASINSPNSGLFNQKTDTAESSALPFFHGMLAYTNDSLGTAPHFEMFGGAPVPFTLGLNGFYGREDMESEGIDAWGISSNTIIPLISVDEDGSRAGSLALKAQGWLGENMDSYFGNNGHGIYQTEAGEYGEVSGFGFNVSADYFFTDNFFLVGIYGYEENDLNDLVDEGTPFRIASGLFEGSEFGAPGVDKGQSINVALWYNPLEPLFIGLSYDYRQADYNDGVEGDNNRINFTTLYHF